MQRLTPTIAPGMIPSRPQIAAPQPSKTRRDHEIDKPKARSDRAGRVNCVGARRVRRNAGPASLSPDSVPRQIRTGSDRRVHRYHERDPQLLRLLGLLQCKRLHCPSRDINHPVHLEFRSGHHQPHGISHLPARHLPRRADRDGLGRDERVNITPDHRRVWVPVAYLIDQASSTAITFGSRPS